MAAAPFQLPLNLSLQSQASLDNYNREDEGLLINSLQQWLDGAEPGLILLRGPFGTGKTHLLNACAALLRQRGEPYAWHDLLSLSRYPAELLLEQPPRWLLFDNLQAIESKNDWQIALYQLVNRVQQQELRLLISINGDLQRLSLADLRSRLHWGLVFQLQYLSEPQLRTVLQQRAAELGLVLADASIEYLLRRYPRELPRLLHLLQALDRFCLQHQRLITRPLLREFLATHEAEKT